MKKKHIKFKPLQELYDHGDTLLNPKAISLRKVPLEKITVHQASVEELSWERKDHKQLPSSEASTILCNSCQSSHSEEYQSLEYSKTLGLSENLQMFHKKSTSPTADVFDCQGDNGSCISKDDDVIMTSSNEYVGADHKNEISRAPSVDSSCPDVLKKSLNGQTIRIGSLADQPSVEEGDKSSMRELKHSSDNEHDGLYHKVNEKTCILANTKTGLSDDFRPATILNNFDRNDYLKSDSPITSSEEPHLQSKNIMHRNGSEDLVDVRVCDICGDVGREALLVLCSKCNDGAEHIYCMSPKMDKVPEGDWLCEECMLTQDPKRLRQSMVKQSDSDPKPSCLHVLSKFSATIASAFVHADRRRKPHLSEASCLFDKRLRAPRSEIKKRTVVTRAQLLKISSSGVKTRLTHVNPLKSMDKEKDSARQVSSFVDLPAKKVVKQTCSSGDRSPKPEQKFCGGSLNNGKSVNSSDSNVEVRRSCFVYKRRNSSKENGCGELKKGLPDNKACKSSSSTGGSSVPMDVSNFHSSGSTRKDLTCESGKNFSEKCYSLVNETNQQVLSIASSGPMEVCSSGTNVVSKISEVGNSSKRNVEDKKAMQVNKNAKGKAHVTLAHEANNSMNLSVAGSDEERTSASQLSYTINSPADNVNAYGDQRMNLSTQNSEADDLRRDDNDHSIPSYKSLPFDLKYMKVNSTLDQEDIDHSVPFAISAVPESRCIWKGIFKLEKSGELPTDSYGVQAHLSNFSSPKFAELVHKLSPELLLKKVPRSHTWPIQFQKNHPTELDIALYFYAQDSWSYEKSYRILLESMTNNDLVLEASCGGFQLLVFPSSLLPARSQCWNSLPFLWGVFGARKVDGYTLHSPSLNIDTLNQCLYSTVPCGSEGKFVSAPVSGSVFASCISQHSMQGSESVDPVVLQFPNLVKSEDLSTTHEEPLLENNIFNLRKHQADNITFTHAWRKEDYGWSLRNYDLQKGNRFSGEDLKSIGSEVDIIRSDLSIREPATWTGFCSDGNYKIPGFSRVYDSASEPWQWHYVGSWIVDSGSSDGGGGATSADEPQVEPLSLHNDLSLNLCLGSGSESEATINLDLSLGIPTKNKYPPNNFFKDESSQDGDVSLVLSLGLPCSAC